MKGKIIVIEGTDCSGKETQSKLLTKKLINEGYKVKTYSFPMYDTATGKIVGGPYLGKTHICDGWFNEGANDVPAKVASLYFAADRLYNIDEIKKDINNGFIVILDRYVTSNMAHQSGKIKDKEERIKMMRWLEELEYNLLELPKPDIKVFLHMPYIYSKKLQKNRKELDQHEMSLDNLLNAENAYLEMVDIYDFYKLSCIENNKLRSIEDINNELFNFIISKIKQ